MQIEPFLFNGDVPVFVGRGAADDGDIDRKRLVEEHLPALEIDQLDERLLGPLVHPSAFEPWIDEGVQADGGQESRPAGGDLARQKRQNALGQVVGLDFLIDRQLTHYLGPKPVAADDPLDQTLVGEPADARFVAAADARDMHERQIVGLTRLEKFLFDAS